MKITNTNGKIRVATPYNADFVAKIKKLGGKWEPGTKTWEVDERSIEAVRAAMRAVYGQDDMPQELVTVRINTAQKIDQHTGPVVLFGRNIATAWGRDSGARVGEGVCFEKGGAESGGSMKNWYTYIKSNSQIVVYDVPKAAAEKKLGWKDEYGTFEIITNGDPLAALKAEKEALLKRLAEIDDLLGGN